MPTPNELARAFKAAIDRQDAAALSRLAKAYSQLYERMQGKLDSLLLAISKLEEPTSGQVMRLAQYKNLITSLETELTKYSAFVEVEIRNNAMAGVELAVKQTEAYLAGLGYTMAKSLPANAIYSMLGFLQENSPLWKRIGELAPYNTKRVADALLEGIAFGYNPAKTAKMFENLMGGGLTDAMRMTRTAQLYASREASRAMYIANEDVVEGWYWWTSLDSNVCMACAAMHGTEHKSDESMNSHYNCRCTSIPKVRGYDDQIQTGEDWFSTLSEAQQKEMMGAETYELWKDGQFKFSDLATRRHDDVYGEMLARMPLKDLINND